MNNAQQQVQALAGVMQAVCQIEDIANRGETDAAATRTSLTSTLQQSADDLDQAVGSVANLRYGLQRMQGMLQGEQKYLPALQYAMAVMQMAKNMRRSDSVQQAVARELELINMSINQDSADKQNAAAADHLSSADAADGDTGMTLAMTMLIPPRNWWRNWPMYGPARCASWNLRWWCTANRFICKTTTTFS